MKFSKKQHELQITGKLSGWRVYKIRGLDKTIVARKGGPSAEQIKLSPQYEKVRKFQQEFGAASVLSRMVRKSLPEKLVSKCESYVSGKLTARFRLLAEKADGETGKRPISMSKNGYLLQGFEFNSKCPLDTVFRTKFLAKTGSIRGQLILHTHSYTPTESLYPPEGAEFHKIFAHLIMLSDYIYNEEAQEYVPFHPDFHGQYTTLESDLLPIINISRDPNTTKLSLYDGEVVPTETGLLLIKGIVFYKKEGSKIVEMDKGNALKITNVL